MLVHCFWLLDSNLGLNSEFVCSLFGLEKEFGFEKKKKKTKPANRSSPAHLNLTAQRRPTADPRRPPTLTSGARPVSVPFPALRRLRLGLEPESDPARRRRGPACQRPRHPYLMRLHPLCRAAPQP
jgi:hypothetical protein